MSSSPASKENENTLPLQIVLEVMDDDYRGFDTLQ